MSMEMLGGVQTYSKQHEGVELMASMVAYVNGSLMAKDNGWDCGIGKIDHNQDYIST